MPRRRRSPPSSAWWACRGWRRSGWTETAIIEPQILARAADFGGDRNAGIASLLAEKQPSLRTSRPEEIGALALWLAHPMAHNITGAAIPIDGGWTAQ